MGPSIGTLGTLGLGGFPFGRSLGIATCEDRLTSFNLACLLSARQSKERVICTFLRLLPSNSSVNNCKFATSSFNQFFVAADTRSTASSNLPANYSHSLPTPFKILLLPASRLLPKYPCQQLNNIFHSTPQR